MPQVFDEASARRHGAREVPTAGTLVLPPAPEVSAVHGELEVLTTPGANVWTSCESCMLCAGEIASLRTPAHAPA